MSTGRRTTAAFVALALTALVGCSANGDAQTAAADPSTRIPAALTGTFAVLLQQNGMPPEDRGILHEREFRR